MYVRRNCQAILKIKIKKLLIMKLKQTDRPAGGTGLLLQLIFKTVTKMECEFD